MNKNAASPADFEQKIMNLVKNRKYLDFAKSHALSGGGLGALIGGGMGAAQTAAKQMRGDMTDEKGGDIMGQYLGSIGKGALTGGTLGAGAGALRGAGLRGKLRSSQLDEVKNALRGGAHPEALYNELISRGKLNPMSMEQYFQNKLPGRNKLTDMAAEHAYGGTPAKLPIETMAAREKAKEGIESFALSGNTQHLDAAGLGDLEKGLLIKKHREITASGGNPLEHPEFNDIKERMLNAKHLVPAERPVPGVPASEAPAFGHLDTIEAELQKEHDTHLNDYNKTGNLDSATKATKAHAKLTNIRRAKHHADEYMNLAESNPEKAREHMRESYKHMRQAGIPTPAATPPAAAPSASPAAQPPAAATPSASPAAAPSASPATSVESNVPESSRVLPGKSKSLLTGLRERLKGKPKLPGKTNISGEAAKDYTHTPVDMPEGKSPENKRKSKSLLTGLKEKLKGKEKPEASSSPLAGFKPSRFQSPQVEDMRREVLNATLPERMALGPNTAMRAAKQEAMGVKPTDVPAATREESLSRTRRLKPQATAEAAAGLSPSKMKEMGKPGKEGKSSRKLVPEEVGQSVTSETKLPTSPQLSEEEAIDAAKKELAKNKESAQPAQLTPAVIKELLSSMSTLK